MEKDIMVDCDKYFLSKQSAFQKARQHWRPSLPYALENNVKPIFDTSVLDLRSETDIKTLKSLFPETSSQVYVRFEPNEENSPSTQNTELPLRVGVVLSGGQAPGGHNVIAGLFDYLKKRNPKSTLFGFLNGPHGIYSGHYKELDEETIEQYRNQGGFHMICSGRHKIETSQEKADALKVCTQLNLDGLVVIGGDDSNTNAAILAEYFRSQKSKISVVGCPKTIDGDLRNRYVEASFGFDTAVKTYSELIGNVASGVATCQDRYHFIRLMGRSASHIALECALQTHPNMLFVGEEVHRDHRTLKSIVDEIVDLILRRAQMKKNYGLILLPEGLIEFIPEVGALIRELNDMLAQGPFDMKALTETSQQVFFSLPSTIQNQLLLDRDAHGNVQVSRIATEELLMQMVSKELQLLPHLPHVKMTGHFFGYEGRCALPTLFDANYCYALGQTAGILLTHKLTSYMAVVRHLDRSPSDWIIAGCPLQWMMTIEKRSGKMVPVIKKYLVELDTPLFALVQSTRDHWKWNDCYRHPGPIQYELSNTQHLNYTLCLPKLEDLLLCKTGEEKKKNLHGLKTFASLPSLVKHRCLASLKVPLHLASLTAQPFLNDSETQTQDKINKIIYQKFPLQSQQHGMHYYDVLSSSSKATELLKEKPNTLPLNIGVVYVGTPCSGPSNILHGLYQRLEIIHQTTTCSGVSPQFKLIGFNGSHGLMNQIYVQIDQDDLNLYANDSGFELLGVTVQCDAKLREPQGLEKVVASCHALKLNGLVLIGNHQAVSCGAVIAEHLLELHCSTSVVVIPASYENNLGQYVIETCIGSHSATRCCSSIVGNILTDSASAQKYWYIVRLVSHTSSLNVIDVAFETHPNVCLVGERYAKESRPLDSLIQDVADSVCCRAEQKKNFGLVLFSDALFHQIPELDQLIHNLRHCFQQFRPEEFDELRSCFELTYKSNVLNLPGATAFSQSSTQLLQKLPPSVHRNFMTNQDVRTSEIALESIIIALVENELAERKKTKSFSSSFTPVTYLIESQGVTPIPADFDCQLALTHGYLACFAIESMLTGYITSVSNVRDPVDSWKTSLVPLLHIINNYSQLESLTDHPDSSFIKSPEIDLKSPFFMRLHRVDKEWKLADCYCNPGPIQLSSGFSCQYGKPCL